MKTTHHAFETDGRSTRLGSSRAPVFLLAACAAGAMSGVAAGQLFFADTPPEFYAAGDRPESVSIGDLDGDGVVTASDVSTLVANWGAAME